MPTGSYTVTAGKTGYITQTQTVTVNKGTTTSQNFALVWELGTLTGKVTKAGTTTVISGATVTMGTLSTTTNSSGIYTLNNVLPGAQSVTVSKAGYAGQTQSAVVSSGVATTLNFALESGKLTGKVTRAGTTTTISGATVTVGGLSTTTNSYGDYTFSNMPTGTYDITVSKAGYTSRTQSVTISNGMTTTMNLALESGKLIGKVTRAGTTTALSGVTVKIGDLSATTNSYGDYIFNNVPAGTYAVTASKTGYVSQTQNATINSGATTTLNLSL
jgi:hypothetical protein